MSRPSSEIRLRFFLAAASLAWLAALPGAFLGGDWVMDALQSLGARSLRDHPMVLYWARMMSGLCGFVGILYARAAWRPASSRALIPWLGGFMVFEGGILAFHGLRLDLPPLPWLADTAACLLLGLGIGGSWRGVIRSQVRRAGSEADG